jgi:hypothetical protein
MSYRNQLQPWCIIRHQTDIQGVVNGRFRHRHDADAHLKLLSRSDTKFTYSIMFDPKGLMDTDSLVPSASSPVGVAE